MEMNAENIYPLVSLILPTYNVYPYLAQCLDSILLQTYKNIEVIIVIDGATDGSYELAKKYANKDKRFVVYWQENAGSGSARNNGLSHANGKFVLFIDPDDWIKEDYVERFINTQKEGDYDLVITTSEKCYFSSDNSLKRKVSLEIDENEFIGLKTVRHQYAFLLSKGLVIAPTNKLYKMSLISKYDIKFPDLRRSQDFVFNYRYYDCISSVKTFNYHGYCYRIEVSKSFSKLKPDYYKTIKMLYNDTTNLLTKWDEHKNIPMIATQYTDVLSCAFESCIATNQPISKLLEDKELQEMVKTSAPHGIIKKCFKYIYLSENVMLMKIMMKIKHFIKLKLWE